MLGLVVLLLLLGLAGQAGNLLLLVPMSGFRWGLQPCSGRSLEAEGALSFGLLCFLEQSFYWELAHVGRCPALVRLCLWFCPGMGLTPAFAITDVLFFKKRVEGG